jgi:hypothetical protein
MSAEDFLTKVEAFLKVLENEPLSSKLQEGNLFH